MADAFVDMNITEPIVFYRDIHWWANIFKTDLG